MRRVLALYPGTFDPPTLAHVNIIERAAKLADKLIVCVAVNTVKTDSLLSPEERSSLLNLVTEKLTNVEVVQIRGLVSDYAISRSVDFFVRGLRMEEEFIEFSLSESNRKLCGIETVYLMGSEEVASISSSLVREIYRLGEDLTKLNQFVPSEVHAYLTEKKRSSK